LLRKEIKEVIHGQRQGEREQADQRREQSRKTNLEKRKRVVTVLWFKEELRNKLVLGARSCG
jgi:hypothetical protein